jgi:cleavage and polyadenylation specificity factor subunit 5
VLSRLNRLQEHYEKYGMRRSCEAILVVHEHNHPHVLMLQIANAFFKLPGDYVLPHEEEVSGFQSRLTERLSPPLGSTIATHLVGETEESPFEWKIHDCVAQWWRPNFETFMYPFIPAHVTRPKECKKMYLIQLPKKSMSHDARQVDPRNVVRAEEYEVISCTVIRVVR